MQMINQPPRPLGDTTARVLEYLRSYIAEHKYAPLLSEIAEACSLASRSVAQYHIANLERRGIVTRGPLGAYRSISLVNEVPA